MGIERRLVVYVRGIRPLFSSFLAVTQQLRMQSIHRLLYIART